MENLSKIKEQISTLDIDDTFALEKIIKNKIAKFRDDILQELEINSDLLCPHCNSIEVIIWGNYRSGKRYMCKNCNRTFTSTTGTVIHNLHEKAKFIQFVSVMFNGDFQTIKSTSEQFGISQKTSIEWRHRLLICLREEVPDLIGEVEMDDVWFLYSQKGRKGLKYSRKRGGSKRQGDNNFQAKLLITKQRKGELEMSLLRIGRIKGNDIRRKLAGKFKENCILYSDKHPSIKKFSKDEKIRHQTFKAKEHIGDDRNVHVQTVNNVASRLVYIVNHKLRGVSTKYLQNYATWFKVVEKFKEHEKKTFNILKLAFKNKKAWAMYTNIEQLYRDFIINYSKRTYRCPTVQKWRSQSQNYEIAKLGVFI